MKIRVGRQVLYEALSNIQNVVEKRNTMPILSHFLLDVKKKGSDITATDIETAIREPLDAAAEKEGRLCIPARKLFEIIKEVDSDIVLESDDAQWVRVTAGKSSFRLACLSPEEFPAWPTLEDSKSMTMDASLLLQMIEKTLYSAGESDTRYTLNGLLFHLSDSGITVVGTDGHRMAVITKPLEQPAGEEKKVIVPRKTASELRKFLAKDGKIEIVIGKNHILFKIGEIEFLARLIEGTYPNYSQVIPATNDKTIKLNRDSAVKGLRRVSVMSRERSNAVRVDIDGGVLQLTSSNPDIGEAKDEIAIDYAGEALTLGYNAKYLLDVLVAMTAETVTLELKDQLSPTLVKEDGDESYRCVVMPMRI